jgi:hypothetical protein
MHSVRKKTEFEDNKGIIRIRKSKKERENRQGI